MTWGNRASCRTGVTWLRQCRETSLLHALAPRIRQGQKPNINSLVSGAKAAKGRSTFVARRAQFGRATPTLAMAA